MLLRIQAATQVRSQTSGMETQAMRARALTERLATPAGQRQLGRQAAAHEELATDQAEQQAQRAQARAAYLKTPRGQGQLQLRAMAQSDMGRAGAESGAQEAQARLAEARTPMGWTNLVGQAKAQLETRKAQSGTATLQQQATNVASYGPLAGGAMNAAMALGKLTPITAGVAAAFAATAGGLAAASNLGAAASPTHAATLDKSFELVKAKMGSVFLPAMDTVSGWLQGLAGEKGPDGKPLRSFAGLAPSRIESYEGYQENLQASVLNQGPLDQKILEEHLRALLDIKELLTKIPDNRGGPTSWRY